MKRKRPTDLEQLISDYYRDHATITRMKYKWVTPKLPEGNYMKNDNDEDDIVLPKKQSSPKQPGKKKSMSPVLQVMKAVTDHAISPKKKAPKIPNGPSKANLKKPQKSGRVDKADGPSAEDEGEA